MVASPPLLGRVRVRRGAQPCQHRGRGVQPEGIHRPVAGLPDTSPILWCLVMDTVMHTGIPCSRQSPYRRADPDKLQQPLYVRLLQIARSPIRFCGTQRIACQCVVTQLGRVSGGREGLTGRRCPVALRLRGANRNTTRAATRSRGPCTGQGPGFFLPRELRASEVSQALQT